MLQTTGRLARQAGACPESYETLRDHLGGKSYGLNTLIGLDVVCEVLGLTDALWTLRCVLPYQEAERNRFARLFACACAERVLPLFEQDRPDDPRIREAIAMARRFAMAEATSQEMLAAFASAWNATRDASWPVARDAACATWNAAWVTGCPVVRDAVWAARAAAMAARAAVWPVRAAELEAQRGIFLHLLRDHIAVRDESSPLHLTEEV